ncbi:MAG: GNAT family N-acetyltransferase [Micromonosporaceae bacterium]|nr:GNAT family N-acetyltransferase [Micromonosporaceae bacterium]
MVREWDPRTAPSTEIEAILRTLNAVLAADLPDDPPWQPDTCREYLAATMPGERRVSWLAQAPGSAPDSTVLGAATILLFGDIGVLDILVHPAHRRSGIGRALLAAAVRRAYAEGFGAVGAEVVGETPAVDFYQAHGFTCAFVEIRNVLRMSNVDWKVLDEMAEGLGSGYHLEYFPGGPPEHLYPAYAEAKELVRDSYELGDLELRPSSYDADRLAASLATLHARGMRPYIVVGIHDATGKIAGLTEVVVPAQHPGRADQYDTVVVPPHRGYGLGRAMKARMLLELRDAEPQLTEMQTWNAFENEPMLKVNSELGFVPDRQWFEYEASVPELARRLGVG